MLDLAGWPKGMRVIARKERPHPGAQLRITDIDGHRVTCFATSTKGGQLADLELRHRRRARCEDRIRCAKDTGLRNLPLQRLRPEPDLDRDRRPGLRPARLDGHARPGRQGPQMGTQAAPPPPVLRRRPASSAAAAASGSGSPPDGPGHPTSPPRSAAWTRSRPADQHHQSPTTRKGQPAGPWNPPPGTPAAAPARPRPGNRPRADHLRPARPASRKIEANETRNPTMQPAPPWIGNHRQVYRELHDARVGPLGALDIHYGPVTVSGFEDPCWRGSLESELP